MPPGRKAGLNDLYGKLLANAITIPDEATQALCSAAKDGSIYVVIGISERNSEASGASLFNTLLYIDETGTIAGKHRKLIPTGGERIVWAQGDGSTLNAFDTSFGKLGGLICWENYMPLARQAMYSQGVQIYVAATWDGSDAWLASMRHLAKEGGMFVISCCTAMRMSDLPDRFEFKKLYPEDREWINQGNSVIVAPDGKVIAGPMNKEQGILYADLDLTAIPAAKWILDTAGHYARPDVFTFTVNKH
jgi:nitrilase